MARALRVQAAESALTFRRLSGSTAPARRRRRRSPAQPLHPWTIPNAIGFVRLALIPVFLVLALSSGDGRDTAAAILFAVIGWSDYLDGIAARVTGQYSRLGALLDPLVDRLLVLSGVVVCWHFDLLPRWALARAGRARAVHARARPLGAAPRRRPQGQLARAARASGRSCRALFFAHGWDVETLGAALLYVGLALVARRDRAVRAGRSRDARGKPSTSA